LVRNAHGVYGQETAHAPAHVKRFFAVGGMFWLEFGIDFPCSLQVVEEQAV
jgi:hypothetical protein